MAAYQFSQQPSMPPDLVPVPLPDDRVWSTNSPEELAMRPAPLQGKFEVHNETLYPNILR